jgi:hypothetical protein
MNKKRLLGLVFVFMLLVSVHKAQALPIGDTISSQICAIENFVGTSDIAYGATAKLTYSINSACKIFSIPELNYTTSTDPLVGYKQTGPLTARSIFTLRASDNLGCAGSEYSTLNAERCRYVTANTLVRVAPQTIITDLTPRIMYWQGKVNQHVDNAGTWQTDPDGVSGAEVDKLTYCKKWYPSTISVEPYKSETIDTWHERYNINNWTATQTSYKCVQQRDLINPNQNLEQNSNTDLSHSTYNFDSSTTIPLINPTAPTCDSNSLPSIKVISPNGGEIYKPGQQVAVKWNSCNIIATNIGIYLKDKNLADPYKLIYPSPNDGNEVITLPTTEYSGMHYGKNFKIMISNDASGGDYSDNLFTISNDKIKLPNRVIRTLKLGVRGDDVKELQKALGLTEDGVFGRGTALKVKQWQASNGLKADGSFGSASRTKLFKD